jgi:hypothetical protein
VKNGGGLFLENGPQSHGDAQFEARVNEIASKIINDATYRRRILNLQELCDMEPCIAQFEQYFPDIKAYFFSICGRLKGEAIKGAMFAGNCILVFSPTLDKAQYLADHGLHATRHFGEEYAELVASGIDPVEKMEREHTNAGLSIDAGGRKTH